MSAKKLANPEEQPQVHVVLYRRDFYSAPQIQGVFSSESGAMDYAWDLAKKKFRYTGPKRNDYSYFDQAIRIDPYNYYE